MVGMKVFVTGATGYIVSSVARLPPTVRGPGDHGVIALDTLATSAATQALLGWTPEQPALLDDLATGTYFTQSKES